MNGYGTIERMYRPLGIGTIKTNSGGRVIFTQTAVRGGNDGYHRLAESDQVQYRVFEEEIAGAKFAGDVWQKSL